MADIIYTFKGKWKEELICSCELGEFGLEFPMGIPTVYLPTESQWQKIAPVWAQNDWQNLHLQLQTWCKDGGFALQIDETAIVF
jgi:hypothetical protein